MAVALVAALARAVLVVEEDEADRSLRTKRASEAALREAGLGAQAFRGSAQVPSEPLVDGLSWHRGYRPLRRADLVSI